MGKSRSDGSGQLRGMGNTHAEGHLQRLADVINDSLRSVSEDLPKLESRHPIFLHDDSVFPDEHATSVEETMQVLWELKNNKATGADGIPAWTLKRVRSPPDRLTNIQQLLA